MSKWMLRQAAVDVPELARQWQLPPVIAHILAVRGFRHKDEVRAFWHAEKQQLAPPQDIADLPKAVQLLAEASKSGKRIAIFGDYDADGITSTVILYRTLAEAGADVIYYIPQRESEGYGLNNEALYQLKHERQAQVILTCDNGISAFEQVLYGKSLGLQMVVLDHHDIPLDGAGEQQLVAADAVVDPKRQDCPYPFKHYCAAGLSYRFSQAFFEYLGRDWAALEQELLPFATLGTVCDLVDLSGDNRCLVKRGLPLVASSQNLGLAALRSATGIDKEQLTTYHLGFRLGPCVNASGRLEAATLAVEMFLTDDPARAGELAQTLAELNETRKTLTEQGTRSALQRLEEQDLLGDKILVVHCPEVHESVAGIIAGKIKERFHKPVVVAAGQQEIIRASCRSIEVYNIFEGLSAHKELFTTFGGHPMAAGLSMPLGNLPLLRRLLNENCQLSEAEMQPVYRIDKQLNLQYANLALAKQLQHFEPFGKGNHAVIFADKQVSLQKIACIGKTGQVMRLALRGEGARYGKDAICFQGKEQLEELLGTETFARLQSGAGPAVALDLLYSLEINTYQGRQSAQIQVKDFRLSQS